MSTAFCFLNNWSRLSERREEARGEGYITLVLGEFGREEQSVHWGVGRRGEEGRGEEGPFLTSPELFCGVVRKE